MARFVRGVGVVALALAAACSRGGSREKANAGSSGSAGAEATTRSADGVVASVSENAVKVKTQDGRVLDFLMKDDVKVTLAGGEATSAVVIEGAPVRVSFKEGGKGNELVSIDVEPKGGAGAGAAQAPAQDRPDANQGNRSAATAPPPGGSAAEQRPTTK